MNVLLVHPRFPVTYWGFQYANEITGYKATIPPLGLLTVAALLPDDWSFRLVDRNWQDLDDADLDWADAVLVGGMRIQIASIDDTIARARSRGVRTVVGGAAVSTDPELFADADVRVVGEIEGFEAEVTAAVQGTERGIVLTAPRFPDVTTSPVPRFDLLAIERYASMSLQYSRGCPFRCEFCDIIKMFGRRPRTKTAAQVEAELDALYALGHRGNVFVVDDNFIGNQKAASELLPAMARWQDERDHPFAFGTEASVNLAGRPKLLQAMVDANFDTVFLGIETPSPEALAETRKTQNLAFDQAEAVRRISAAGIEVLAGFIVGFDSDGPEIFELQRRFIQSTPVSMAMVGMLMALPKTDLWARLAKEGRLRSDSDGSQGDRPNFDPILDERTLLEGFRDLNAALYTPDAFYDRAEAYLALSPPLRKRHPQPGQLGLAARVFWRLGVVSPYRARFWRLLRLARARHPSLVPWAIKRALVGEHMFRYTAEHLVPDTTSAIARVDAEREAKVA